MEKLVKPIRITIIFILLASVLSVYLVALYDIQIVKGEDYLEISQNNISTSSTVEASRGSIYDRNGELLVTNQAINNITFNWSTMLVSGDPNGTILTLIQGADARRVAYQDSLPITEDSPFEYTKMTDTQESQLSNYRTYYKLDEDTSAVELMAHLRNTYHVDASYSAADARLIVGVRYELDLRYAMPSMPAYVFAEDVDTSFIAFIGENGLTGVEVTKSSVRQYKTKYASQVLGTIGLMDETETVKYSDYPMDAYVGKSGIELLYESELHGTNGTKVTTTNDNGAVVGETTTKDAQPGNNIYLTLDIKMQEVAETALNSKINEINAERTSSEAKATGGAVVVIDIDSGDVLTMASAPTYDLSTYSENIASLTEDENKPLLNRTIQQTYSPASTFKLCTALTALSEGVIAANSTVNCTQIYHIGNSKLRCMGYHNAQNVTGALAYSCNYFFYNTADNLSSVIQLEDYAAQLGLGQNTGIELYEEIGRMDGITYRNALKERDPEYFTSVYGDGEWYDGNTLNAAIGQGDSQFTPLQLAGYISTIANSGTRNSATILKDIKTYDDAKVVYEQGVSVLNEVESADEYFEAIQQGMYESTQYGTSKSVVKIDGAKIAGKTGTAQTTGDNDEDNSLFVCYAPYDDPEIAIVVVIEHGGAGSNSIGVASDILEYYFSKDEVDDSISGENTLLP